MTKEELIKQQANYELARRDFFHYCHLMADDFYKKDREYLVYMCNELQDFYFSDDRVCVINVPPRFGKSRTAGLFTQWIFGINPSEKVMTGSYNETLSTSFSKSVRNAIQEEKADPNIAVYNDIFPDVRIKQGDGAMNLWSLEGEYSSYLATSPTGTATGFGASLLIIDDLIKNAEEAYNENVLDKHWQWFTNTMLSRLEAGGKIIIIMTRWATNDLAGRVLRHYSNRDVNIRHISLKAYDDETDTMLCEEVLPRREYEEKKSLMGEDIVAANYNQEPVDLKGQLYKDLKEYKQLPDDIKGRYNYTDTADTGKDYLCSINYAVDMDNNAYILDVLYTKEAMETTEPLTADMLYRDDIAEADIESNNGGRGFARQVERHLKDKGSNRTKINWFHQSSNKEARILSNATRVSQNIYFPRGWNIKYPEFYRDITRYQREGKNAHDDGPDTLTGIIEKIEERRGRRLKSIPKSLLRI